MIEMASQAGSVQHHILCPSAVLAVIITRRFSPPQTQHSKCNLDMSPDIYLSIYLSIYRSIQLSMQYVSIYLQSHPSIQCFVCDNVYHGQLTSSMTPSPITKSSLSSLPLYRAKQSKVTRYAFLEEIPVCAKENKKNM